MAYSVVQHFQQSRWENIAVSARCYKFMEYTMVSLMKSVIEHKIPTESKFPNGDFSFVQPSCRLITDFER